MAPISALTAFLILAAEVGAVFIILTTAHDPLTVNIGFSILAGITTWSAIPALSAIFVKAGLKGMDLAKKSKHIMYGGRLLPTISKRQKGARGDDRANQHPPLLILLDDILL